jgi:4-hydroxybenzoate polyprenyltransferase
VSLVIFILLYDVQLKRTVYAPALMGGCRTLNVLLGASTINGAGSIGSALFGFPQLLWWVSIFIGIYVTGVTLLARKETVVNQDRWPLGIATLLIATGLLGLAFVNRGNSDQLVGETQLASTFPLLIGLISLPILRRVVAAVVDRNPLSIQRAVMTCLRSIIILDAAICFLIVPERPLLSLTVLGLLIPALVLGRWLPST